MLSCDKATILVEKKIDTGLTLIERLKLTFHTSMCSGCTNYQKHSVFIHKSMSANVNQVLQADDFVISQLKMSILEKLKSDK